MIKVTITINNTNTMIRISRVGPYFGLSGIILFILGKVVLPSAQCWLMEG